MSRPLDIIAGKLRVFTLYILSLKFSTLTDHTMAFSLQSKSLSVQKLAKYFFSKVAQNHAKSLKKNWL